MTFFWLTVTCLVALVVVAVVLAVVVRRTDPESEGDQRKGGLVVTLAVLGALAVACFIGSVVAPVGTKNVAVLTTFGKPSGTLSNGFHLKAPWQVRHELSDAIQTDTYASDRNPAGDLEKQPSADSTCVNVRIARQATGCVNVSIRWQIMENGVDYLFRNYKDNDAITRNLVLRDLQSSMNEQFSLYDPLGIDESGNSTNKPLAGGNQSFSTLVQRQMQSEIGQYIDVSSVIIPILNFDKDTQARINALQSQVAQTRVAKQAEQTAIAQANANKALAASVSNDPNVLVSKCLDIVERSVDQSRALPAGFSCFGSGSDLAVGVR